MLLETQKRYNDFEYKALIAQVAKVIKEGGTYTFDHEGLPIPQVKLNADKLPEKLIITGKELKIKQFKTRTGKQLETKGQIKRRLQDAAELKTEM